MPISRNEKILLKLLIGYETDNTLSRNEKILLKLLRSYEQESLQESLQAASVKTKKTKPETKTKIKPETEPETKTKIKPETEPNQQECNKIEKEFHDLLQVKYNAHNV